MNYEKEYESNMIQKAQDELHYNKGLGLTFEVVRGEERMTIDGRNYFNNIVGVMIFSHEYPIAKYMFDKKTLYHKLRSRNLMVIKDFCSLVNSFVGYERMSIKYEVEADFEQFKDEVDPECAMSDYEIAQMYNYNK